MKSFPMKRFHLRKTEIDAAPHPPEEPTAPRRLSCAGAPPCNGVRLFSLRRLQSASVSLGHRRGLSMAARQVAPRASRV